MSLSEFTRDGLQFDLLDEGPPDGEVVVLLHGYPETKESWAKVIPAVTVAGYRVLAPDQRGYSPRARPRGRWAYRSSQLVADVIALADAAGADRFHLVGHDWGGAVAWAVAAQHPDRLRSLTVLSTPHPRAFMRSMVSSGQALHSWYMFFFQLPLLADLSAMGPNRRVLRRTLTKSGMSAASFDHVVARFGTRRAMASIVNWYRAMAFGRLPGPSTVPTLYVYSTGDFALGRKGADLTAKYVKGPYRYEILDGVSHWIADEASDDVTRLFLDHAREH